MPTLGARPALPTAVPGGAGPGRPVSAAQPVKVATVPLITSTPAPFATKLPPTPIPIPKILHDTVGKPDCMSCHRAGQFGVPPDHLRRSNKTCLGCHVVDYNAVKVYTPPVPHSVAGREQCFQCHLRGINGAPPMPGEHTGRPEDRCQDCHPQSKGKKN